MSRTNNGWVKLHRKLLDSPVWANPNLTRFWTWCLLRASYQDITVKAGSADVQLQPGQFLYSHADASIQTGLSQRVVRSCVETLGKEMGIVLGREKGSKKSILTILNWESYQGGDSGEGRKTGKQKGKETGTLYYKEDKKIKKQRGVTTAVATASPIESPTWMQWIDACRGAGRKDPAPSSGALQAARDLAVWVPDLEEQRRIMDAYLSLDDDWVRRQGFQLAILTKYRFEAVRAIADGTVEDQRKGRSGYVEPSDEYEASPEDVALWVEFAKSQQRKDAANG